MYNQNAPHNIISTRKTSCLEARRLSSPRTQLPAYLAAHPSLLKECMEWKREEEEKEEDKRNQPREEGETEEKNVKAPTGRMPRVGSKAAPNSKLPDQTRLYTFLVKQKGWKLDSDGRVVGPETGNGPLNEAEVRHVWFG